MIALTLAFVILAAQRPAPAPPQAERDLAQMVEYALRKAEGPEIPPVPLGADGSTRHGVMIDSFRFLVGTARELAALGKVLTPEVARTVPRYEYVVVAYPITCGTHTRKPTNIEVFDPARRPVRRNTGWIPVRQLRHVISWIKAPDRTLAAAFRGRYLPSAGEVVLTYDGPACPGTEKTVRLPIKAESPVKIVDVTPVAPAVSPPMPPSGAVEVRIQFTVDLEGMPTNLHVLTGPSGFNDAALDAVRQWRFASYTINGEPAYAPTTMRTTVTFRRNDR